MVDRIDITARRPEGEPVYSDFLVNFNAHPNNGALMKKTNGEAVKRALKNLILTEKGERFFQPRFGSEIKSILFEVPSAINRASIKSLLEDTIKEHEPRVEVSNIVVGLSNDEYTYNIDIYFRVINTAEESQLSLQLDRVR